MKEPEAQAGAAAARLPSDPGANLYVCGGKRALDFLASMLGLVVLSPALMILALLVKVTSAGPALYRQSRVGRDGRLFRIVKFRTMADSSETAGPEITAAGDLRITTLGTVLRRWKLDELPQLWNVLKGEMSLVGPRPELPAYVARYSQSQRAVLAARPGMTDPASIAYRREEELLARQADAQLFYREAILPRKLALSLQYIGNISLAGDVGLVLRTVSLLCRPPEGTSRESSQPAAYHPG